MFQHIVKFYKGSKSYLWTVKVTAAVYTEFVSKANTFKFNFRAPGRSQTIYIILLFSIVLCF